MDLISCLKKMGANIEGGGSEKITVKGVDSLNPCEYKVMDDRIEIGTYLTAVTMTKGKIEIKCTFSKILETIIDKLKISGANITFNEESIELEMDQKPNPVNISTAPFPLFPTDMQAQFIALNSISTGKSKVVENVFENRFMHVQELIRMGGDINLQGNTATITGSKNGLFAAPVMATDLRASASLVLAGLVAKGQTKVDRIYHIDRGYERIEEKLNLLGANIERVSE